MAFAASLAKIVVSKKQEVNERQEVAKRWTDYESKLLDEAVDLFRQRCEQEAGKKGRTSLMVSFEVLSREVQGFPTYVVKDGTYVVSTWGEKVTAEAWFYASHGANATWSPGAPVLFAEMLESLVPKFLLRLSKLGFSKCTREAGTWKVSVRWKEPSDAEDVTDGEGLFADDLTQLAARYSNQEQERQALGSKWIDYENKLLEEAVELFKQRCTREAEQQRLSVTVSFEVLSRDIPDFPKHSRKDNNYFVASFGGDVTAEIWFYATRGSSENFSEGAPVLFAEVLEGMMPKFVDRLQTLGFASCSREAGTWKVRVAWADPDEDPNKKRKLNGHA